MVDVVVRAVEPADLEWVAAHMRAADIAELAAAGLTDPLYTLRKSTELSALAWTGLADGVPALVFGVTPLDSLLGERGAPWALGTDLVTQHQRAFIRHAPQYIEKMLAAFSHLLNFVHAENDAAVRWLRRTGFELHPAKEHGPHGEMFHLFEMKA